MNEQEKISVLEINLTVKYKDVTDYDYHEIATEYVQRGGWNDNKEFKQVLDDIPLFMSHKLANKSRLG